MRYKLAFVLAFALSACLFTDVARGDFDTEKHTYHIGVLARRGVDQARQSWSPTADYLNEHIPGARFDIVPLLFEEIVEAVEEKRVDFLVVNSSIYVELQAKHGVSRLITQKDTTKEHGTLFGGVIFCRSERKDIQSLEDLKGKSFAAVDPESMGGWRAAWRELKAAGIDPERHFKALTFPGTHDAVVYAVRNGAVDAGTVATPILETMSEENKIDLWDFKILNQVVHPGFPYLHSTRLYPAWPLCKLDHTPESLAEKVTIALLGMPSDHPAAIASNCAGWTVPSDYASVDECLKELGVGPYANPPEVSLMQVVMYYKFWIIPGLCGLGLLVMVLLHILNLNRNLQISKKVLELEVTERMLAAQALRESQRRLSTLMSNLPGMAYRCLNDLKYTMQFASGGCEDLTGYKPEALIDNAETTFADLIHSEDRQRVWEVIQTALESRTSFQTTYRMRTAGGIEKSVFEQGRGVFSESGELICPGRFDRRRHGTPEYGERPAGFGREIPDHDRIDPHRHPPL